MKLSLTYRFHIRFCLYSLEITLAHLSEMFTPWSTSRKLANPWKSLPTMLKMRNRRQRSTRRLHSESWSITTSWERSTMRQRWSELTVKFNFEYEIARWRCNLDHVASRQALYRKKTFMLQSLPSSQTNERTDERCTAMGRASRTKWQTQLSTELWLRWELVLPVELGSWNVSKCQRSLQVSWLNVKNTQQTF